MKRRPRSDSKLPQSGISPQEAIQQLAACQLGGHLQGNSVIVGADEGVLELLKAACLGRSAGQALQAGQAKIGATEQTKTQETSGDTSAQAATSADNPSQSDSKRNLSTFCHSAAACESKGGILGGLSEHTEIWGAVEQIGMLGSLPIHLPAGHAAITISQPGICFSRSAAQNVRVHVPETSSAEQPGQQQKVGSERRSEQRRRGKHAKRKRSDQQELGEGTKGWLLSVEEAFFMTYALACLAVTGGAGPLSCQELWEECMRVKQDFADSYLSYHHFRSKGWVVRPGTEYGVDYVLYDKHPSDSHSSYCVLTLTGSRRPAVLRWTDVEAASRVCSQVLKKLLLLYVFEEPGVSRSRPECLSSVRVEERVVQRWVPSKV